MLGRILSTTLMLLCGVGLLVSWIPQRAPWQLFEIAVYALAVAWFVGWMFGAVNAAWSWLFIPFAIVVGWGPVQVLLHWTIYPYATITDSLQWGAYASVFFLAFQGANRSADGRRSCRTITAYASLLGIVCLLQYFMGNGKIFWLFTPGEAASGLGPFLNRDHFASFAILVLPAAAVQMRQRKNGWLFGLASGLLFAAVIASTSRAGAVLVTVEIVLLFAILNLSRRVASMTSLVMIAFVLVVGWQGLYSRLQTTDSYAGRRELAQATVRMIAAKPVKGSGLGTWTLLYPSYALKDFGVFINAAHNDWLQWASDGGIGFAAAVLLLCIGAALIVRRTPWALGVPMVFLHSLVDFPMHGHFLPAGVFLVFGLAARSAAQQPDKTASTTK